MKCSEQECDNEIWAKSLCSKHYRRMRRTTVPDERKKATEYTKRWKANNPELHAAQQARKHEKNKVKDNAYVAQWKHDNWNTYKSYLYARKQRVKQATPEWTDLDAIEQFYYNCPKGYHVDHALPLNGKNISGLHVINNLQYLTASDDLKKSNKDFK